MAWVTPTNVATGDVLTAATWNQDVVENWNALGGAWTSHTPTWSNLTVGNATQSSRYIKVGRLVIYSLKIVLGSTSSVSGTPEFTLPATGTSTYNTGAPIGRVCMYNSSADAIYIGHVLINLDFTKGRVFAEQVNSTYNALATMSSTIPFGEAWATSDNIQATVIYEAAS